jgi:hypothetical protein
MLWSVAVIWMGVLIARLHAVYYALGAGAQFTCFTGTKVQMLTQKTLQVQFWPTL